MHTNTIDCKHCYALIHFTNIADNGFFFIASPLQLFRTMQQHSFTVKYKYVLFFYSSYFFMDATQITSLQNCYFLYEMIITHTEPKT